MTQRNSVLGKGLWSLAVVLMVLGMLAMPAQVAFADEPVTSVDADPVDVVLCGLCVVNCTRDALGCTGACNSGFLRPCNILCSCMPSGATGCDCTL